MLATGQSPYEGDFYVTDTEKAAMYKLDQNGNVTWYVALTPEQADGKIFTDFRQHKLELSLIHIWIPNHEVWHGAFDQQL